MKLNGLKKAVEYYNRLNSESSSSHRNGCLLFNTSDGRLWTNAFYPLGHNLWMEDHPNIVDLGKQMADEGIAVSMKNVKDFIASHYA